MTHDSSPKPVDETQSLFRSTRCPPRHHLLRVAPPDANRGPPAIVATVVAAALLTTRPDARPLVSWPQASRPVMGSVPHLLRSVCHLCIHSFNSAPTAKPPLSTRPTAVTSCLHTSFASPAAHSRQTKALSMSPVPSAQAPPRNSKP